MKNIRLFYVLVPALFAFVSAVNFSIIYPVLKTTRDHLIMFGGLAEAAAVMGFVTWLMSNKGKKVRAELTYLMNLQRELKM